jgi:alpha-1,6-mannosyltransferase
MEEGVVTRRAVPRPPLRSYPLTLLGVSGFVGAVCVLIGVSQTGSPFVVKAPGAWFFGVNAGAPAGGGNGAFLGIMVVYAGLAVMVGSWVEVVRTLRRHPHTRVGSVAALAIAWALPVLVMPPLFSRDVYSYVAQGDMVTRGFNPYAHGPSVLGSGRILSLVDPLWRHARAPYGPAWERLCGAIVHLTRHDVLAALVGFRAVALVGVVLIALGVGALARSTGRDEAVAVALAVLNPLVLLVLLGGAHNDALMLGLLVAGCAVARHHRVFIGLALCVLAAEVKIPALIGVVLIGWWWSDGEPSWRRRMPRMAVALSTAAGLTVLVGAVSGLGWRWLGGLSDPGVVVSWLDPASAVGLTLSHLVGALGAGRHTAEFVRATRAAGLVLAACISVALIARSRRVGDLQALGWSLVAFVVLGPVIWPWYETWGFVVLAVVAEGWTLRIVVAASAVACFADVPGAHFFGAGDPVLAVICWVCLLGAVAVHVVLRLMPSFTPGAALPPARVPPLRTGAG